MSASLTDFRASISFPLDAFQIAGCEALDRGQSVLVAAPTGAGKTIVGEYAVHLALLAGRKAFYTTPIKALSNQKYLDLRATYGPDQVGLLTGDSSVNPEAPVVVMTTEVLRNMLYAESTTLHDLGFVVMDEVHYLADRFRGPVWEEVILHLAPAVQLVALSATVSNVEEFGDWLTQVRGDVAVVVSEHRPVPLWQHVMIRADQLPDDDERIIDAAGGHHHAAALVDLYTTRGTVNPLLTKLARREGTMRGSRRGFERYRGRGRGPSGEPGLGRGPSRTSTVLGLAADGLLPAIYFLFSRAACDGAVDQCLRAGLVLTTPQERVQIEEVIERRCEPLPAADRPVLGFGRLREALLSGVAAHHAGMLPLFKETVEELFTRGLIKVVFATETLALGINMPARSVVLEKLDKWDGTAHVPLTPGEYTQLTGRAGRRGIDVDGHAVVVEHPGLDPQALAGLASTRSYPLRSAFQPSYNMAVNLVDRVGARRARQILEMSFAQFQADRGAVGLAQHAREQQTALDGYAQAAVCDRGDIMEFFRLRTQASALEKEASRARRHGAPAGQVQQLLDECHAVRRRAREHPCASCPDLDDHLRWARRYDVLATDHARVMRRISARTGTVVAAFDRICAVLRDLDYLESASTGELAVTTAGAKLERLYAENDLTVAECLRRGIWDDLRPAALAAAVSILVHEPRRDAAVPRDVPGGPDGPLARALRATERVHGELEQIAEKHRASFGPPPELGFVWPIHQWATGRSLDTVLHRYDFTAGDFVRWSKQILDVLGQIADAAAPSPLATNAIGAISAIRRDVVAYSGL